MGDETTTPQANSVENRIEDLAHEAERGTGNNATAELVFENLVWMTSDVGPIFGAPGSSG